MNRYLIAAALVLIVLLVVLLAARKPQVAAPVPDLPRIEIETDEAVYSVPSSMPGDAVAETQAPLVRPEISCGDSDYGKDLDLQAMAAALRHSYDPEHLLMAALYGGRERGSEPGPVPKEPSTASLFKGLQIDPRNELLLWNAITLCSDANNYALCAKYKVSELATELHGDNATFWLRLAGIRAGEDDMRGTLEALERALAAPEYKEYLIEHVEAFTRGISAYNNAPYGTRVISAFELAAELRNPEIDMIRACRKNAPGSVSWLYTCLEIGRTMEAHGRSLMTEILGLGLQSAMYEIAWDERRVRAAEIRSDARREILKQLTERKGDLAVLTHDEQVSAAYLEQWKAGGERQAIMFLQHETRRLMTIPGYNPCD